MSTLECTVSMLESMPEDRLREVMSIFWPEDCVELWPFLC